jgi:hypothetical protein
MAPSQAEAARRASGTEPVNFCFPVTWTYLRKPIGSWQMERRLEEKPVHRPPREVPPPIPPESSSVPVGVAHEFAGTPRPDSWEMVIPKAGRPGARSWPADRPPLPPTEPVKTPEPPEPPEPLARVEAQNVDSGADLGFETLGESIEKPGGGVSLAVKIALVTVAVLALGIAGMVLFKKSTPQPPPPTVVRTIEVGPALPVALDGWIPEFAPQGGTRWGRHISVLRGSQELTDFRLEFPAQIDYRALGWAVRVKDPKNFYVMKLEIPKPLPDTTGVLTHFAVIDGQEQPRIEVPLPLELRSETVYAIRVDALGNTFTTWIQGRQVDQWADAQIQAGGVGLYSESGERSTLKGNIGVFPLVPRLQLRP